MPSTEATLPSAADEGNFENTQAHPNASRAAVYPDQINRALLLEEQRTRHHQAMESALVHAHIRLAERGQWIDLGITVAALAASVITAYQGHLILSGIVGAGTIPLFVIGRHRIARATGMTSFR